MIDPICSTPSLDTSVYKNLTSPYLNMTDLTPFLCEVMKLAGVDDIDPVLYLPESFDYFNAVLNFSALTGVGDPRLSLGHVLSASFNEFYPLALAQVEVIRAGGCQVVDGYICDSDGNKRKETTIDCPANFTLTPITSQQIIDRTAEIIKEGFTNHAQRFVAYVNQLKAQGWVPTLHYYTNYYMFYVKMTKTNSYLYLKYYPDTRDIVSSLLNLTVNNRSDAVFDNASHYEAMAGIIPDY